MLLGKKQGYQKKVHSPKSTRGEVGSGDAKLLGLGERIAPSGKLVKKARGIISETRNSQRKKNKGCRSSNYAEMTKGTSC